MRSIPFPDLVLSPVGVRFGRYISAVNRQLFDSFTRNVRQVHNYDAFDPDLQVDVKKEFDHIGLPYYQVTINLTSATQKWTFKKSVLIYVDSNHLENCLSNNGKELAPEFTSKRFGDVIRIKLPQDAGTLNGDNDGLETFTKWVFCEVTNKV
jgi:hypothetical protein